MRQLHQHLITNMLDQRAIVMTGMIDVCVDTLSSALLVFNTGGSLTYTERSW